MAEKQVDIRVAFATKRNRDKFICAITEKFGDSISCSPDDQFTVEVKSSNENVLTEIKEMSGMDGYRRKSISIYSPSKS